MLLELHRTGSSGVLRAELGSIKKQVIVLNGRLASAESNQPEEHLAGMLLNLHLISRQDVAEISSQMKNGKPVDQAILAAAKISIEDLKLGARTQAIQILASLLEWELCEFHFYVGEGLVRRQVNLELSLPESLVLAARHAASTRAQRASKAPPLAAVVSPGQGLDQDLRQLPLDPAEAFTHSLLTGKTSVAALLPLIPSGPVPPEEIIHRLLLLGLIRKESAAAPGSADEDANALLADTVEELLRKSEVSNSYEILSVAPDATEDEIKNAYHELARKYHPDRFQGKAFSQAFVRNVQALFTLIVGAYSMLSDSAARASYDEARLKRESQVDAALQSRAAADQDRERMAEALFKVGCEAFLKGEIVKAIGHFKECVWLRPDEAKFCHHLGVAQSEVAQYRKEAERHLVKAIALNEMGVSSRLALGKLYLKVSLPRRAETQFREALLWDPDNVEALALLGQTTD
jgi:hypothetical protein